MAYGCSAAILAGGRATRFGGRDKSALTIGGRTILERQIDVLSTVADEVLVVRHDFVIACDMPYVAAPFVRHLFDLSHDADVVVPRTEDGYHPLCAVYSRACLDV